MSSTSQLVRCFFLASRNQYATGHIQLSGDDKPLSAIHFQGRNYGFLKKVESAEASLRLMLKLQAQNTEVILTQTARGYLAWTLEAESAFISPPKSKTSTQSPAPFYFFKAVKEDFCQIKVPDLDQELVATQVMGRFYSFFKLETEPEKVLEVVGRLTQQGDEITVAQTRGGYAVCVLEPEVISKVPTPIP